MNPSVDLMSYARLLATKVRFLVYCPFFNGQRLGTSLTAAPSSEQPQSLLVGAERVTGPPLAMITYRRARRARRGFCSSAFVLPVVWPLKSGVPTER